MRSVIVIPARYGSTRFPGKPLVRIAGVTLIERVYRRAIGSARASSCWVATDDDRIVDHVREFGGQVVMTQSNLATGTDRIAAALGTIERQEGSQVDHVINLQGDEPLIDIGAVDRMIGVLEDEDADVVTLSAPIQSEEEYHERNVVKVVTDLGGNALYFSRSPIPHGGWQIARRHVGVYGYRGSILRRFPDFVPTPLEIAESLEQLRVLQNGYKIRVLETSTPHPGVDSPEDVARIEEILERNGS